MAGITGHTVSGAITTTKAFVAAHPIGLAVVGGGAVAAGAYYWMKKRKAAKVDAADASTDANVEDAATA